MLPGLMHSKRYTTHPNQTCRTEAGMSDHTVSSCVMLCHDWQHVTIGLPALCWPQHPLECIQHTADQECCRTFAAAHLSPVLKLQAKIAARLVRQAQQMARQAKAQAGRGACQQVKDAHGDCTERPTRSCETAHLTAAASLLKSSHGIG